LAACFLSIATLGLDDTLVRDFPEGWLQTSIRIRVLRARSVEADLELEPLIRDMNWDEDVPSLCDADQLRALKKSELARSEYHKAVRDALDAGVSVRLLAQQTRCAEHEIEGIRGKVRCSFCLRLYAVHEQVATRDSEGICHECLVAAQRALAAQTPGGEGRFVVSDSPSDLCLFCGRFSEEVGRLVAAGEATTCGECINWEFALEESQFEP
jgi:hypothetical protein